MDSTQNRGVNISELASEMAKIYTKDRVFEIDCSSGHYESDEEEFYSVENEYTLGGADLSKIEKIKIGMYTFHLS